MVEEMESIECKQYIDDGMIKELNKMWWCVKSAWMIVFWNLDVARQAKKFSNKRFKADFWNEVRLLVTYWFNLVCSSFQ